MLAKKPLISGAALGLNGQLAVYNNGPDSPCYRCVWPKVAGGEAKAATCDEAGVLGAVTGVIGTLMALEGCKLILGLGRSFLPFFLSSFLVTGLKFSFKSIQKLQRPTLLNSSRFLQPHPHLSDRLNYETDSRTVGPVGIPL